MCWCGAGKAGHHVIADPRRPGGAVKPASPEWGRSEAERLDGPEGRPTIRRRDGPAWCHARTPSAMCAVSVPASRKLEVAAGVADDHVIEQRHVEDVGCLRQQKREARIIRAWCGIAARVVVHDEQGGSARCQARGHEHVRKRDGRTRARAAGEHVPGEELVASGEARNGKDLHRLAAQEWRQRGSGDSRIAEGLRR